jgi:streptogramin lyase
MSSILNPWLSRVLSLKMLLVSVAMLASGDNYYSLPYNRPPRAITVGPDGAIWSVCETVKDGRIYHIASAIARISTTGVITEYPLSENIELSPTSITTGPDGALWLTDPFHDKILRMTTAGVMTEYTLPGRLLSERRAPNSITAGPDGALWFTQELFPGIGRITVDGIFTEYPLGNDVSSSGGNIVPGPEGALWFNPHPKIRPTNQAKVGRITAAGVVTMFPFSCPADVWDCMLLFLRPGPDGALWFTLGGDGSGPSYIGRITTRGVVSFYLVSSLAGSVHMTDLTAGPDGLLWFRYRGVKVCITPAGAVVRWSLLDAATYLGITVGSDGNVWFYNSEQRRIGRFIPGNKDLVKPISSVSGLPAVESAANFTVQWSGTDP